MKHDIWVIIKVCLLLLILILLVFLVFMFNTHLVEIRDMLQTIKGYMKNNPVNTYPLIP